MATKFKAVGRFGLLRDIVREFEEDSRDFLDECIGLGGLFKVLTLPDSQLLSPFFIKVLQYYLANTNTFNINGHTLGITLEDVLFLTKLRIDGDVVLIQNYNDEHSVSIFGEVINNVSRLRTIILDKDVDQKRRKVALLMIIVVCFIMPSPNGISMYPAFLELVSDPDRTSGKYAWGAAVLAYFQFHLERFGETKKLSGCTWLFVCFFLIRIPKLWDSLGIKDARQKLEAGALDHHPFPMAWIMDKLHSNPAIFHDHRKGYQKKMHLAFLDLKDEEICWKPYSNWVLQDELKEDRQFITRLGPIFCNNYVVQHKPHNVTKQLGAYELDPILDPDKFNIINHRIRVIDNRGGNGHDYFDSYKKELAMWDKKICLEVDDSTDDDGSPPPPPPPPPPPRAPRHKRRFDGNQELRRGTRQRNRPDIFTPSW